jgi:hypothetical protein
MTARVLRRVRRYAATIGLAASGFGPMAILPLSIDHFLRPAHLEVVVKECPGAQKRATMALKAERARSKKEPRGIMRWLL